MKTLAPTPDTQLLTLTFATIQKLERAAVLRNELAAAEREAETFFSALVMLYSLNKGQLYVTRQDVAEVIDLLRFFNYLMGR